MLIPRDARLAPARVDGPNEGPWTQTSLSDTAEVVPLLERVVSTMAEYGYPPRTCRELRLALEEAVINGLRHGNGGDASKRVVVRYWVGAEEVLAEVEDEGPGFDPAGLPDPTAPENLDRPCGRGLLLIRYYTTWFRYHGRGNHLTLGKRRALAAS